MGGCLDQGATPDVDDHVGARLDDHVAPSVIFTTMYCVLCLRQAWVWPHSRRLCQEGSLSSANGFKLAACRNDDKEGKPTTEVCNFANLQTYRSAHLQICKFAHALLPLKCMVCKHSAPLHRTWWPARPGCKFADLHFCKFANLQFACPETCKSANHARASQVANLQKMLKLLQ